MKPYAKKLDVMVCTRMLYISFYCFIYCFSYAQDRNTCNENYAATIWPDIAPCDSFEHGNWTRVFEDDFSSQIVNTDMWWTCSDGWQRNHGNELQYYLDDNVVISDGSMHLTAKRVPGYYTVYNFDSNGQVYVQQKYYEYTSGWIQTKARFQYGLFEVKCKIPKGKGFWPAFWFYGNEGEIDVFEFRGDYPMRPYFTLHIWPYNSSHDQCSYKFNTNIDFSDDYHVFSLEWDEFKLIFRIDGVIMQIIYKYLTTNGIGLQDCQHYVSGFYTINPYFPSKAQSLRLNLAISQNGGGIDNAPAPDSTTVFPASIDIDYVRIYKKNNPNKVRYLCNYDLNEKSNIITGDSLLYGGCSMQNTIDTNQSLFLYANKGVVLTNGFCAAQGSFFTANVSGGNAKSEDVYLSSPETKMSIVPYNELPLKEKKIKATIHPNPNNGSFYFCISDTMNEPYKMEIKDVFGRILFQQIILSENKIPIDLNVPNGIYVAFLYGRTKNTTIKFIINNS